MKLGPQSYFADYYVLCNIRSEFCHMATTNVYALALSKTMLLSEIFPAFPVRYFKDFQGRTKVRYAYFKQSILKHRETKLNIFNKRNRFYKLQMKEIKPKEMTSSLILNPEVSLNSKTSMNIFNFKNDISEVIYEFHNFCTTLDEEFH